MWKHREPLALAAAAMLVGVGVLLVPSWDGALLDVCHDAVVAAVVTIVVFIIARRLGSRGVTLERIWSSLFLAGMPIIDVVAWLASGGAGTGGALLGLEVLGLAIFGAAAWLGLRRSAWFLVGGIAAHGLAWDAWHHLVPSGYVPSWYASGCLLTDVGLSLYLATRVGAWGRVTLVEPEPKAMESV